MTALSRSPRPATVATDAPRRACREPIGRSVSSALSSKTGPQDRLRVGRSCGRSRRSGASSRRSEPRSRSRPPAGGRSCGTRTSRCENYKSVLGSSGGGDNLSHFFLNSLRITIPATIISVGIALLAAYAFSWMKFKGRDWLFVAVIAMLVVPLQMSLVPLMPAVHRRRAHRHVHDLPRPRPQQLASCRSGSPTPASACRSASSSSRTSSRRCHARSSRRPASTAPATSTIFYKLVVPLSVPAMASLCIFQFVYIWNDLLVGRIFGGTDNLPIIAKMVEMSGSRGQSWHLLTAAAFVTMVAAAGRVLLAAALLRSRTAGRFRQGREPAAGTPRSVET